MIGRRCEGSGALPLDEGGNGLVDAGGTLAGVCAAVDEVDPAGVESLDHLYAGGGILHALGAEERSCSSAAAVRPTSSAETIGTARSSG